MAINNSKGKLVNKPKEILDSFLELYNNLYAAKESHSQRMNEYCLSAKIPQLEFGKRDMLGRQITVEEQLLTLKIGADVYTAVFYKQYKEILVPHLLQLYNEIMDGVSLPPSGLEARLVLIPKTNKDPTSRESYRPISLMNTDYKIFTKILASRLKNCISTLINIDQYGFVPKRYIADAIRKVMGLLYFSKKEKAELALISLDVYKAFDSVDWNYFKKLIRWYVFGNRFNNAIQAIYSTSYANISINSISGKVKINGGTKQGCPLSALLFILALEPLANKLRNNQEIRGFNCGGVEKLLTMHADDMLLSIADLK